MSHFKGVGNFVLVDRNGPLFEGYHSIVVSLKAKNTFPKFFAYLFLSDAWRRQLREDAGGTKVYGITQKILKDVEVLLPPLEEQRSIAAFLTDRCSRLDAVIEKLLGQIDVLQELRQSVICRAVTKGLNSDATLKDSSTSWAGDVPVDWEIRRLKHLASFTKGLSITKADLVESGLPVVSYGQIHSKANKGATLLDELVRYIPERFAAFRASRAEAGSFIFADTSEDLEGVGNFVFVDRDGPLFGGYHSIVVSMMSAEAHPKYLAGYPAGIERI